MTATTKHQQNKTFSGLESLQVESELNNLIDLAKKYNVSSYLEIGAGCGDTFHAVLSKLGGRCLGVAVDIDKSAKEYLSLASQDLRENYEQTIFNFHGFSQDGEMIKTIQQLGPYDLVFIDGSVLMEDLVQDWINYSCVAKMVAFSGIAGTKHKKESSVDTPLVWDALVYRYPHIEFTDNSDVGIGVIFKDLKILSKEVK